MAAIALVNSLRCYGYKSYPAISKMVGSTAMSGVLLEQVDFIPTRFEVLTALKIPFVVSWAVTLYSDVVKRSKFHPEDESSKVLRNVGIPPHHYAKSQSRTRRWNLHL